MRNRKYVAVMPFEVGQIAYRKARLEGVSALIARVEAVLALELGYRDAKTRSEKICWLAGIGSQLGFLEREKAESELEEIYRKDMLAAYGSGLDSQTAMEIIRGLREQIAKNANRQEKLF